MSTSSGSVRVYFDPIDLTWSSPQACSFNVHAKTSLGLSITELKWDFGDGSKKRVPYCCQTEVSEVQYHAYNYSVNPKMYTVTVVAYDNAKQSGYVQAVVNWSTPVPEYSNYGVALLLSMLLVPILVRRRRALPA
jgi:PKD repeat protein